MRWNSGTLWRFSPVDLEAKHEAADDRRVARPLCGDVDHLRGCAKWLCLAHDMGNGGVSRAYKAAQFVGCGGRGWQPAYPETTGYIIPSFFELAKALNDGDYRKRAFIMADWESRIQLDSGAVMGSVVTAPRSPAVFNTGQVIFGWLAAYAESRDGKYLFAARKAGDYLIGVMDPDGAWRKGNSKYALNNATTYNSRVAWALAELGLVTGEAKYAESACRNIEFALTGQNERGWFANNCLTDPDRPLLHTIVYAIRGIFETGVVLKKDRFIEAAAKSLDSLLLCQRADGGVAGRLNADWSPAVRWDCVTGDAQLAGVWLRLHAISGEPKYSLAARKAIDFVKGTQNLQHPNPGIRGGIKGSFPFDGCYGQFEMLNWAAKFFVDALLMIKDQRLAARGIRG